ncbi:MAG: GNAT family N-acetyltransferase [Anaerolineales bacterium]|jgi:mycothiol synthase
MSEIQAPTHEITLEHAPEIPGLVFRAFQGQSDYPHILALINAAKSEDDLERSDSLEDVTNYYTHLHNCDPYEDMLFAEVDGDVVAYSRVEWNLSKDGEWLGFHINFMHPAWRRKGIGRTMLRYNESRLRQIAARQLEDGELRASTPLFFDVYTADSEAGKEALLLNEGYQAVRHEYSMVRPLSEPIQVTSMPEGLEVRRARPEHYRRIWDASQEAFRDHWGFIPAPEEEYQRWLNESIFGPTLWKVAWDGEQVAGMVLNFINERENEEFERQRGYTEAISVRRPWRRRGLARALLTRSLKMFKDMGMTEAALGVDTQNLSGALRLYENVGFRAVRRETIYRKQFSLQIK